MVRQPLFHFLLASCTGPDVASDCNEEEERAGYWRWQDGPDAGCIDPASQLAEVCSDRSLTQGYSCPATFEELWNVLDDTGYGDFCPPSAYHCFDAEGGAVADMVVAPSCGVDWAVQWTYWFSPDTGLLLAMERADLYPSEPHPTFCCDGRRSDRLLWGDWTRRTMYVTRTPVAL